MMVVKTTISACFQNDGFVFPLRISSFVSQTMRTLHVLLIFLACSGLSAQVRDGYSDYKSLACSGPLPDDFRTYLNGWMQQMALPKGDGSAKTMALEAEFRELSSYQLMSKLYSGGILYGDKLSAYVARVADSALRSVPELRKRLRFYVLKSTDFNAYSTQSGVIFVSVGLLARIETEAQLAYILCHEAAHFTNNHNYKGFLFRKQQQGGKGKTDVKRIRQRILEQSKEDELEADRDGLKLFRSSPYATDDIERMFGIMLYSYLPFAEIPFDTAYFNSGSGYILPHKVFPAKTAAISAEEDVPDSMRTHPNILKRRTAVRLMLENENTAGGLSFAADSLLFADVKRTARYEMPILYMADAEYEEALYSAYLIGRIYGRSLYTDKIIASAVYLMAKHKNHKTEQERMPYNRAGSRKKINVDNAYWESIEGESQAVYFMAAQMTPREMNILAARHAYAMWQRYGDVFFLNRFKDLMPELTERHKMSSSDFYGPDKTEIARLLPCTDSIACNAYFKKLDETELRISKNSETYNYSRNAYFLFAFREFYTDSLFASSHNSAYYTLRYGHPASEPAVPVDAGPDSARRILMFYPDYNAYTIRYISAGFSVYNYRANNPKITPLAEMKQREALRVYFALLGGENNMPLHFTGIGMQKTMDTEAFNRYQQLLTWYSEKAMAGEHFAYVYSDEAAMAHATSHRYLVYTVMNSVDKGLELVYVLFDLKTGKMEVLYSESEEKAGPDSNKARNMMRKAFKASVTAIRW